MWRRLFTVLRLSKVAKYILVGTRASLTNLLIEVAKIVLPRRPLRNQTETFEDDDLIHDNCCI